MKKNKPIRILQIVPIMRSAGIENFIMNIYRKLDREKIQFDFLVHSKFESDFDTEITKLGGKIYRLSFKDDKNIFKYIKDLNNFFKLHNEYKIVHGEMQSMMPLYLFFAKKYNVPVRIAHSHNSNYEKTLKGFVLHIFSRFSSMFATDLWACSINAGKYLFGKKDFCVIHNAIDSTKYSYNAETRKKIRSEENLCKKFVVGHIGRFELQKNHEFLIDIFKEINKINPDSVLLCFGTGKLEEKIKDKVKQYHLDKKVIFKGVVSNTYEYYQAMDCFILPSLYEGLPLVGVEAQISGLPCFFSNTITNELKLSNNSYFLNLKLDSCDWAKFVCKNSQINRKSNFFKEYDLDNESKRLERKYIEMSKR